MFCNTPPTVANTESLNSDNTTYPIGSQVEYRCLKGYIDVADGGSRPLTCALFNDQVYWVGDEPICALSAEIGK